MNQTLIDAINAIVNAGDGTWQEKRDRFLEAMDDGDKTNLSEFIGWFDDADLE